MARVTAVCDQEAGCPLYKERAVLEFTLPSVATGDNEPVCAVAVQALQGAAARIAQGASHDTYGHLFCGGCETGKAWWTFEPIARLRTTERTTSSALLGSLSRIQLFGGVHAVKIVRLAKYMREVDIPDRQVVIERGRPGEHFYIALEGEFEVVQHDDHQVESTLAVLPPGECFGEMSMITGEPASATVRARGPARALRVSRENFHKMLAAAPELAITLARILAARLAKTGRWVTEELRKGIVGRLELIGPAELIQAMNVNGQTGMLIVQNGETTLTVYLQDGQVHEVHLGTKEGEEAFYEFLSWVRGSFRFEPVRKDPLRRQVTRDTVGLLLEGMRRADELRRGAASPAVPPPLKEVTR